MLDTGYLYDPPVDVRNTLIIFTSNLGTDSLPQGRMDYSQEAVMEVVQKSLPPPMPRADGWFHHLSTAIQASAQRHD